MAKFSETADYKSVLQRLKNDFDKKWALDHASSHVKLSEFQPIRVLGAGGFGLVKLVKRRDDYYAMKMMSKERLVKHKQVQHTLNERRILQAVDFPFLINLRFAFKDNTTLYIVMPFISGGEMFIILRRFGKFTEDHAKFYAAQVMLAFEYLHFLNLIYRDLKPENIMVDSYGYVKITDFGFCKMVETRTYTFCGTPEYVPPEIVKSKPYGKYVDWWSYGVLVYEFMAGFTPFFSHSRDPMVMYDKICAGRFKFPEFFSSDSTHLIHNLLQVDVTKRFGNLKNGVADIKTHAWFKDINFIALLNKTVPAPYIPKVEGPGDASNFDPIEDDYNVKESAKCLYEKEFIDF